MSDYSRKRSAGPPPGGPGRGPGPAATKNYLTTGETLVRDEEIGEVVGNEDSSPMHRPPCEPHQDLETRLAQLDEGMPAGEPKEAATVRTKTTRRKTVAAVETDEEEAEAEDADICD